MGLEQQCSPVAMDASILWSYFSSYEILRGWRTEITVVLR
jgi:hypothetical protein